MRDVRERVTAQRAWRRGSLVGVAMVVLACGGGADGGSVTPPPPPPPPPPVPVVKTLDVSPATATLLPGAITTLTATVRDQTGATMTGRTVTWATSAPSVATVSTTGVVTGVGGAATTTATITATAETKSGTATVTVLPSVARVVLVRDTASLVSGATVQLAVTLNDAQGGALTGRPITWTSLTPAVATVTTAGLVTALQVGRALVVVSAEGKSDTATVSVQPSPLVLALENSAATTRTVGAGVDTLRATAADGTVYTLAFALGTFMTPVAITMTPLTSVGALPLAGGFAAGVDLKPSGLVLGRPATLTMTTGKKPGANQRLVGLTYSGTGQSVQLAAAKGGTNTITMLVTHFSGSLAGFGTTQDITNLFSFQTGAASGSARFVRALVAASVASPRNGAAELQIVENWFDQLVLLPLRAVSTDVELLAAVADYADWTFTTEQVLDVFTVVTGGRNAPSLVSRRAQWDQEFVAKVKQAIAGNLQLCAAPGLTSFRIQALDNALFWYRRASDDGFATVANGLDLASFQAGLCARVVAENLALADPLATTPNRLDVTFKLIFTGGQLVVPLDFYVRSSAVGATVALPGEVGTRPAATALSPAGFLTGTVTPDGSGGPVTLDLNACYAGGATLWGFFGATYRELCGNEHITRGSLAGFTATFTAHAGAAGQTGCSDPKGHAGASISANLSSVANCVVTGVRWTNTATNFGTLTKGTLKADVVRVGSPPQATTASGSASASMQISDVLVINAPGLSGTLGTFIAEIEITGNLTVNAPCAIGELDFATWQVFGGVITGSSSATFFNPGTHFGRIMNCPASNGGTSPPTVRTSTAATFMYGTPFQFILRVDANADVQATNAVSSSSARANISYRWLGMQRLAPSATLTSKSQVDWSKAVP